jgi:hypothetical protein
MTLIHSVLPWTTGSDICLPVSSCEPSLKETYFDLFHMPLCTSVAEFTPYCEVVEVASTLELLGGLPDSLNGFWFSAPSSLPL